MKILVTGVSGYIGRNLIRPLKERGHEVVGFDRQPAPDEPLDRHVRADLLNGESLANTLSDIDCVFHLAAAKDDWGLSRQEYFRDNVRATRALLEEGRRQQVRRWLFYSSVSAQGPSDSQADESADMEPVNPYGESKAAAERLFHEYAEAEPEASVTVLRPSVVYGPGNPPNTNVYRLIDSIFRDRFVMVGDGDVHKTTSYIENLVAATLFVFGKASPGVETLIYVDEPVLTTEQIVDRIHRCLEKPRSSLRLPRRLAETVGVLGDVFAAVTQRDVPVTGDRIRKFCTPTYFDGGTIRDEGFDQPVSNQEAIRRTVEDYWRQAREQEQGR